MEFSCVRLKSWVGVFATAVAAASPIAAVGADWSDTYIGYNYGTKFGEPGNPNDITRHIISLTHVSGYKYGVNFFNVDMLHSSKKDEPANGGGRGAQEVYAVYSHTLSMTGLTGSPWKFGVVKDVGVLTGFDFNSKNDAFGAGLFKIIAGPQVTLDVPGLLLFGVYYVKEYNNNALAGADVDFDGTYRFATAWNFKFDLGLPAVFKGFLNYTGKKGKDGFGNETKAETLAQAYLLWDIGAPLGKKDTFYAGAGVEYWHNKFGNWPGISPAAFPNGMPGTKYTAPMLRIEAHF